VQRLKRLSLNDLGHRLPTGPGPNIFVTPYRFRELTRGKTSQVNPGTQQYLRLRLPSSARAEASASNLGLWVRVY